MKVNMNIIKSAFSDIGGVASFNISDFRKLFFTIVAHLIFDFISWHNLLFLKQILHPNKFRFWDDIVGHIRGKVVIVGVVIYVFIDAGVYKLELMRVNFFPSHSLKTFSQFLLLLVNDNLLALNLGLPWIPIPLQLLAKGRIAVILHLTK